jgi:hypothetical protein
VECSGVKAGTPLASAEQAGVAHVPAGCCIVVRRDDVDGEQPRQRQQALCRTECVACWRVGGCRVLSTRPAPVGLVQGYGLHGSLCVAVLSLPSEAYGRTSTQAAEPVVLRVSSALVGVPALHPPGRSWSTQRRGLEGSECGAPRHLGQPASACNALVYAPALSSPMQ